MPSPPAFLGKGAPPLPQPGLQLRVTEGFRVTEFRVWGLGLQKGLGSTSFRVGLSGLGLKGLRVCRVCKGLGSVCRVYSGL